MSKKKWTSRKFIFALVTFAAGLILCILKDTVLITDVAIILMPYVSFAFIEGQLDLEAIRKIKIGENEIDMTEI